MNTVPKFNHRIGPVAIGLSLIAVVSAISATAAPAPNIKAAITERQATYKKMGAAMKTLNDQLKSDAPSKPAMLAAAQTLAASAKLQPRFFPAGSGPESGMKTDALPKIWGERPAFTAAMNKAIAETGKLATIAAGGNIDAIRDQVKATGATCGGCHRQFRADD